MNTLLGPSDDDVSQSPEYVQEYLEALECDFIKLQSERDSWRSMSALACIAAGCLFAIGFGVGAALC